MQVAAPEYYIEKDSDIGTKLREKNSTRIDRHLLVLIAKEGSGIFFQGHIVILLIYAFLQPCLNPQFYVNTLLSAAELGPTTTTTKPFSCTDVVMFDPNQQLCEVKCS